MVILRNNNNSLRKLHQWFSLSIDAVRVIALLIKVRFKFSTQHTVILVAQLSRATLHTVVVIRITFCFTIFGFLALFSYFVFLFIHFCLAWLKQRFIVLYIVTCFPYLDSSHTSTIWLIWLSHSKTKKQTKLNRWFQITKKCLPPRLSYRFQFLCSRYSFFHCCKQSTFEQGLCNK